MSDNTQFEILLSSEKYKSAPTTNSTLSVDIQQTAKEYTEYDKTLNVNLAQLYSDERNASNIYRPTFRIDLLFYNSYSGQTNYAPFENRLYILNENAAAYLNCEVQNNNQIQPQDKNDAVVWSGLPQYNEFNFIRDDYNVTGYTSGSTSHVNFNSKSASTYNWNFYISYPYSSTTRFMTTYLDAPNELDGDVSWISENGIPFRITVGYAENVQYNGLKIIRFLCPLKHNLTPGEYVKLRIYNSSQDPNTNILPYNGQDTFQVFSLGDGNFGTEDYVFNIANLGYTGGTFDSSREGTFKRVVSIDNTGDTTSKYYVRLHKIITDLDDNVLNKIAFEQNIFGISKKYESSAFTPNYQSRVSIKEGAQTFSYSLNKDIDISQYVDNLKRPISELYLTTIWKGYFGWTYGGPNGGNVNDAQYYLKRGWEHNLQKRLQDIPTNGPFYPMPQSWWSLQLQDAHRSNITFSEYEKNNQTFYYTNSLKKGDVIDGDFCEWNDSEQVERVISPVYHKIYYNPSSFNFIPTVTAYFYNPDGVITINGETYISSASTIPLGVSSPYEENPYGFYYQPLQSMKLKQFSEYIETADSTVVDIPNYAYYSKTLNVFLWRELYDLGYNDTQKLNPNYPFLNNAHYPYQQINFRLIPEGSNYPYNITTSVDGPLIDYCE